MEMWPTAKKYKPKDVCYMIDTQVNLVREDCIVEIIEKNTYDYLVRGDMPWMWDKSYDSTEKRWWVLEDDLIKIGEL